MKKIRPFLFIVYVLALIVLIAKFNPTLFTKKTLHREHLEAPIWNPVTFNNSEISGKDTPIFYRQSKDRNAVFAIPQKNFDLKSAWITDPLNVGIHGASKASPVSDGESIYVGSDSSWFYCFDKEGHEVWKNFLGEASRGVHSTAIIDGNSLFIGSYRGTLYRLNKKTGAIEWMRILGDTIGASPLVYGEDLIVVVETSAPDGYMVRLDKKTGSIKWRTPLFGEQSHSSPSFDESDGIVVIGANNSTLQGFDVNTGKLLWRRASKGQIKSTIAIHDGIGYITSWGKDLLAFKVKDGSTVWDSDLSVKSQVSPALLLKNQTVVTSDNSGKVFAFDLKNGKLLWTIDSKMKNQKSSPVVLQFPQEEKILYYCEDFELCLINGKGRVEKKWKTQGAFTGSPFVDAKGKRIYLSYDEGGLEAFDIK